MTEKVFDEFIKIIETLTGMIPPVSHKNHIRRELEKQLKKRQTGEEELLSLIMNDEKVRQEILNASTINETYFFREERHFKLLQSEILPELYKQRKKIILWSVSCSSGEEAVSLALLASSEINKSKGKDFTVFATDINTSVLDRLKEGHFSEHSLRKDGCDFHKLLEEHILQDHKEKKGLFIDKALLEKIKIYQVNIYDDSFSFLDKHADVIFFRNTLIYAAQNKREPLLQRLTEKLAPGGYFFLASSEVPFVKLPDLDLKEKNGVYYFQKKLHADSDKPVVKYEKSKAIDKKPDETVLLNYLSGLSDTDKEISEPYTDTVNKINLFLANINMTKFAEAELIINDLKKAWGLTSVILFLEGWLRHVMGKKKEAEALFLKTLELRIKFWPARFYAATYLIEDNPADALSEFRNCLKDIEKENSGGKSLYSFFLEDFDPAYFRYMCIKWMEKIETAHQVRM